MNCSHQELVSFSFPFPSGFGFRASLLKIFHHPSMGVDLGLGSSEPGRRLSLKLLFLRPIPISASFCKQLPPLPLLWWLRWLITLYFTFLPISDLCIHQIYFFCKRFVTEPEVKSFSWSSSHLTVLYSETFPELILF